MYVKIRITDGKTSVSAFGLRYIPYIVKMKYIYIYVYIWVFRGGINNKLSYWVGGGRRKVGGRSCGIYLIYLHS